MEKKYCKKYKLYAVSVFNMISGDSGKNRLKLILWSIVKK
jgi:hypothetical protein